MLNISGRLAATLSLLSVAAIGFAQEKSQTTIKNGRPIYEFLLRLRASNGWPVNYEEPRYLFSGDREDVSQKVTQQRGLRIPSRPLLAHVEQELTLDTFSRGGAERPSENDILRILVSTYNEKFGPKFELRRDGGRYPVIGVSAKDQLGQLKRAAPIMDTSIDLEPAERDGNAILGELCPVDAENWYSRL